MFGNFTEEARQILSLSKKEMSELKHPYVGSEHLLLAILKYENNVSNRLKDYNIDYETFKNEIINIIGVGSKASEWFLYTPLLKRVMENAIIDSKENNHGEVTIEHLFSSLLEEGEGVAIRILLSMNVDINVLYNEFAYKISNSSKKKKNKKLLLEELGLDLTKKAINNELDPVIGREKEIKRVLEILSRRTKNNPLLIGEAGVGKTAIVEELSRRIALGDVPISLKNKRIISLDMASTVAGTKYRGEFEDRIRKILKEIEDDDSIILFIDEIHTLVGAGGAEGAIDASNIFKPALARNKLRLIGATTTLEYKKFIEEDSALERRFQKVNIEIPNKDDVKDILMKLKPTYENFHHVSISDEIIDSITQLSEKYIYDRNEPDKSIDILDEVCAKVSLKESKDLKRYHELTKNIQKIIKLKNQAIVDGNFEEAKNYKEQENKIMNDINNLELRLYNKKSNKLVTLNDVAEVVHTKTKIPIYEILNDDVKIISKMEKDIKEKIIGQKHAVESIIKIAKKIKLGFKDDNKCYSMLFCGPSGVGKTELSKIFAKNLVGENNIIRLDMSEFAEDYSTSKIVGAPPGYAGYKDNHNILEEIRNKPYSVLILDEIEKASPSIINLFFQILDNSKIKDASGKYICFNNVTIIMTSNIGFHDINVGFNKNKDDSVMTKLKENFSVPFINRIDNVVIFNNIDEESIDKIIKNKLSKLKNKYSKKKINIKINKKVIDEIKESCNYQEFGARKVDKIIEKYIDDIVIDNVLNDVKNINIKSIKEKISV